jgi:hypothetical protein
LGWGWRFLPYKTGLLPDHYQTAMVTAGFLEQ